MSHCCLEFVWYTIFYSIICEFGTWIYLLCLFDFLFCRSDNTWQKCAIHFVIDSSRDSKVLHCHLLDFFANVQRFYSNGNTSSGIERTCLYVLKQFNGNFGNFVVTLLVINVNVYIKLVTDVELVPWKFESRCWYLSRLIIAAVGIITVLLSGLLENIQGIHVARLFNIAWFWNYMQSHFIANNWLKLALSDFRRSSFIFTL